MQEIKLQGSEHKRRWIWAGIQAQLFHTKMMSLKLGQWQDAGAGFINQSKSILITLLAAKAVVDGQMTLGMMLAVQYMVGQLNAPLQQFIGFIRSAQDAKISLERLSEIHHQPNEDEQQEQSFSADRLNAKPSIESVALVGNDKFVSNKIHADIQIENLSFRYNALSEYVLQDIQMIIPQGKVTAIVGESGCGKTTLLKLLLGFYLPTNGEIRIGNTPLRRILPSKWRKYCGAVMQDGFIFSDTIANNISECDEHPDLDKLRHAVIVANISEFIESLPLGFNTIIGANGNGISQGQRQRILIARAIYRNPSYLFFDEATNALDANNERSIVENLQQYYQPTLKSYKSDAGTTKTVVVVAHRLSTVSHADQIVVLKNKQIAESGTHETLINKQGLYYKLVKNQLELGK